jgi:hypothetical protein
MYFGTSRSVDQGSGGLNFIHYNRGIFHNGYVSVTSPLVKPLAVLLGLTNDCLNTVDVWIQSYMWHGQPLIEASQSVGTFSRTFTQLDSMPLTGYTKLDMYQNTLTRIYKNPHNLL